MKKNYAYIDALRIIACLLVVTIHVSGGKIENVPVGSFSFGTLSFYNTLSFIAVGLFVMISGALMFSKDEAPDVCNVIVKKVLKYVLLYFVWKLVYELISFDYSAFSLVGIKDGIILPLIKERGMYHLWFLPMIAVLYLISPFIYGGIHENRKNCLVFTFVFVFFFVLLPTAFNFEFKFKYLIMDFAGIFDLTFFGGYLGYFVLGYFIHRWGREIPKSLRFVIYGLGVVSAFLAVIWNVLESRGAGTFMAPSSTPFSLFVLICTVALFLLMSNIEIKGGKVLKTFAGLTFGIYLVHPIVLMAAGKVGMAVFSPEIIGVPVIVIIVTMVAGVGTFVMKKIKGVRFFLTAIFIAVTLFAGNTADVKAAADVTVSEDKTATGNAEYGKLTVSANTTFTVTGDLTADEITIEHGAVLKVSGNLRTGKMFVGDYGQLWADGNVSFSKLEMAECTNGFLSKDFSGSILTLSEQVGIFVDGKVDIRSVIIDGTSEGVAQIMAKNKSMSIGTVAYRRSSGIKFILSYDLKYIPTVNGSVMGGKLYLNPYSEDTMAGSRMEDSAVLNVSKGVKAESIAFYDDETECIPGKRPGGSTIYAETVKIHFVAEYEDGTVGEPKLLTNMEEALEAVEAEEKAYLYRIYFTKNADIGELTLDDGKKYVIGGENGSVDLRTDGICVEGEDTELTLKFVNIIKDSSSVPASYARVMTKNKGALNFQDVSVGQIALAANSSCSFEGDIRVYGEITGNGNIKIFGNTKMTCNNNITVHDMCIAADENEKLPSFLMMLNKILRINGVVYIPGEHLQKGETIEMTYAFFNDDPSANFFATSDSPLIVSIDEGVKFIHAAGKNVYAGLFTVTNKSSNGDSVYLGKEGNDIFAVIPHAVLYKIDSFGNRQGNGTKLAALKEAMEAINLRNDYATYEISLLADEEDVDLSGGMPQGLRLISSGKRSTAGIEGVKITTKKDILLRGHLNLAFVTLDAGPRTLYADDKNITVVNSNLYLDGLSRCNTLTVDLGSTVSIKGDVNSINEVVQNSEASTFDCPEYTEFVAENNDNSSLIFENAPSLKVTENVYKKCVDYLTGEDYVMPWKKVLFIGDSITEGVQSDAGDQTFTYTYPREFGERIGVEVVNGGIGGSTVWTGGPDPMVERCLDYGDDFDAIFIMGGINDWFYGYECEMGDIDTERTFTHDYNEMLDKLAEKYADADIFVVVPLDTREHYGISPYDDLSVIRNIERSLAKAHDFYLIDLAIQGVMSAADKDTAEKYFSDGAHPNSAGYGVLGTVLCAESIEMIQE